MKIPIWEVGLYISGPITVKNRIVMQQRKGYRQEDPFYSEIAFSITPHGVKSSVTARAHTIDEANQAALFFIGQMLDSLCLQVHLPIRLSEFGK